jgi:prefoldin subunit 5
MAATENRTVNVFINSKVKGDASIKDLKREYRALSNDINKLPRGSKAYQDQLAKLQQVQGVLNKHRQDVRGVGSAWESAKAQYGGFMKGGLIAGGIAAIGLGVRKVTQMLGESVDAFRIQEKAVIKVQTAI